MLKNIEKVGAVIGLTIPIIATLSVSYSAGLFGVFEQTRLLSLLSVTDVFNISIDPLVLLVPILAGCAICAIMYSSIFPSKNLPLIIAWIFFFFLIAFTIMTIAWLKVNKDLVIILPFNFLFGIILFSMLLYCSLVSRYFIEQMLPVMFFFSLFHLDFCMALLMGLIFNTTPKLQIL